MLRGLVFDLDGTLTHLKLPLEAMRNDTKAYYCSKGLPPDLLEPADGISSSTAKAKEYFLSIGVPIREWEEMEAEVDVVLAKHENDSAEDVILFDGALNTIKHIRELGLKTAILTNNGRNAVDIMLEKIPLRHYFDIIQTRHESPSPKPYPDGINRVIELLGLTRDEAIYVGDALIDGTAATRAGVEFWGVSTGETPRVTLYLAGAKRVVGSLSDLLPLVKERLSLSSN